MTEIGVPIGVQEIDIHEKKPVTPEVASQPTAKTAVLIEEVKTSAGNPQEALAIIAGQKPQTEQVGQDVGQTAESETQKTQSIAESLRNLFTLRGISELFKDPRVAEVLPGVVAAGLGVLAGVNTDLLSSLSKIDPQTLNNVFAILGGSFAGYTVRPVSRHFGSNPLTKIADVVVGGAGGVDVAAMAGSSLVGPIGGLDDLAPYAIPPVAKVVVGGVKQVSNVISPKPAPNPSPVQK